MRESETSIFDVHRVFARTQEGEQLAQNVRYERYKPELMSNDEWVKLLGADVNNLTHMPLTYGLTRQFVHHMNERSPGFFSEDETEVLYATALIHDWGEAVMGDITYSEKTAKDEEEEAQHHSTILGALGLTEFDQVTRRAKDVIFGQKNDKLSYAFNTIERIGYMRTALRAAKHVHEETAPKRSEEKLAWLVADVMANHLHELLQRCETYPPVLLFLANQASEIDSALDLIDEEIFMNYGEDIRETQKEKFNTAKINWMATVI